MNKFFTDKNLFFNKIIKKGFSQKYDGIKGDVNWVDGQMVDLRPNMRRHVHNLPKRKYGQIKIGSSDMSDAIKEMKNPIYLTYNQSNKGFGKRQDIVFDKK